MACLQKFKSLFRLVAVSFMCLVILSGCFGSVRYNNGSVSGRVEGDLSDIVSGPPSGEHIQTGMASWYGGKFHGRKTASGEVFNKWETTAAHRTLPLGTWLQVEHVETGRVVKVKVNDRGPYVDGRIIDLSRGAAGELNMIREGVAKVRLYRVKGPEGEDSGSEEVSGHYTIQVGSFSDESNALDLKARLAAEFDNVHVAFVYDKFYRVRVGYFDEMAEAEGTAEMLRGMGYETWVVREQE